MIKPQSGEAKNGSKVSEEISGRKKQENRFDKSYRRIRNKHTVEYVRFPAETRERQYSDGAQEQTLKKENKGEI